MRLCLQGWLTLALWLGRPSHCLAHAKLTSEAISALQAHQVLVCLSPHKIKPFLTFNKQNKHTRPFALQVRLAEALAVAERAAAMEGELQRLHDAAHEAAAQREELLLAARTAAERERAADQRALLGLLF